MNTSSILTGYNNTSFPLLNHSSPESSSKNTWLKLMDKYIDWEGSPNMLHEFCLFSQLPWFTPNLAACFQSLKEKAKVALIFWIDLNIDVS